MEDLSERLLSILCHQKKNLIVQIRIWIKEAIKKHTKKSLIDDLSKRLLELEIKSNHSIQSKYLK